MPLAPSRQALSEELLMTITPRRAKFLALLASGHSVRSTAESMCISYDAARSETKQLRRVTGSANVAELRTWWLNTWEHWLYELGREQQELMLFEAS